MQLMSSSLDLWKIKELRPHLQAERNKSGITLHKWLQNTKKKVVFSTFISDKCLKLAVISILRSGARKSASVLWNKVADFVNGTCTPSQLLVFLWNISYVLDKLVRSENILFCLILLNNLCSNFMRLIWKMLFSIGNWEFSKLQKIYLRNMFLHNVFNNIHC